MPTVYEAFPKLGTLRDDVLFGDVWEGTDLSKRDRSLVTISVLTALYRTEELKGHLQRALDNGVTKEEIGGMITHLAFYSGWPTAVKRRTSGRSRYSRRILDTQRASGRLARSPRSPARYLRRKKQFGLPRKASLTKRRRTLLDLTAQPFQATNTLWKAARFWSLA